MPINPYFNHSTFESEQTLVQDLNDEAIQIYGHDTAYLVREDVDLDKLFGEDELAKFASALSIEMYIKSSASFSGQSEFMTKFGLHIEDQCTFSVSIRRWGNLVDEFDAPARPREGDIIWLQMTPTNRYLFEIRFVEDKEQLFQLGKIYTYEIRTELMNYSHERIVTGNSDIDAVASNQTYSLSLDLTDLVQPDANITYLLEETVYQGDVNLPTATGIVVSFEETTANSGTLIVQSITGAFANTGGLITGTTSGTTASLTDTPDVRISAVAPDSDNIFISDEAESVIVVRGQNPKRT
jgi:hypothetical protein